MKRVISVCSIIIYSMLLMSCSNTVPSQIQQDEQYSSNAASSQVQQDGQFINNIKVSKIIIEKGYDLSGESSNILVGTTISEYDSNDVLLRQAFYNSKGDVSNWTEAVEFEDGHIIVSKSFSSDGICLDETQWQYEGDDVIYVKHLYQDGSSYETYYENGNAVKSISVSSDGIVKEHTIEIEHIDATTDKELRYLNGELSEYVIIEKNENGGTLKRSRYTADGTFIESNIYNPDEPDYIDTHSVETYSGESWTHETIYGTNGKIAKSNGLIYGYDEKGRTAIELNLLENDTYLRGWYEYEYRDVNYNYEHIDLTNEQPYDISFEYTDYNNHNKSLLKSIKRTDEYGGGLLFDNDHNTHRVMVSTGTIYEETYKYDYDSNGLVSKGYIYDESGTLIYELTYDDKGNLVFQDSKQSCSMISEYETDMSAIDYYYEYQYDDDNQIIRKDEYLSYDSDHIWSSTETYTYDIHGRLVQSFKWTDSDCTDILSTTTWAYSDHYGLLAKITKDTSGNNYYISADSFYNGKGYTCSYYDYSYHSETTYTLDDYGRITSATNPYTGYTPELDEYEYDSYGNCIEHKNSMYDICYEYYEKGDKQIPLNKIYYPEMPGQDIPANDSDAVEEAQSQVTPQVTGVVELVHFESAPEVGGYDYDAYALDFDNPLSLYVLDFEGESYYVRDSISYLILSSDAIDWSQYVGKRITCTVEIFETPQGELFCIPNNIEIVE